MPASLAVCAAVGRASTSNCVVINCSPVCRKSEHLAYASCAKELDTATPHLKQPRMRPRWGHHFTTATVALACAPWLPNLKKCKFKTYQPGRATVRLTSSIS